MNEPQTKQRVGFPAWAAPGMGLLVGTFVAYTTLLQNEPVSPLPPALTLGLGAGIGTAAGVLIALRHRGRR